MKLFSSFNSGGSYETVGFGYGPGIGEEKIFAGSGMGCTGPVILVAAEDHDRALEILNRSGYL